MDVKLEPHGKTFTFSARVVADPPAYAIIGYTDPAGGSNYDATTATAVPDRDGRFTLECNALTAGQRRGAACHRRAGEWRDEFLRELSAASRSSRISWRKMGPWISRPSLAREQLAPLIAAVNARRAEDAAMELRTLEQAAPTRSCSKWRACSPARSTPGPVRRRPRRKARRARSRTRRPRKSRVGYGRPVSNRLPEAEPLLMAGGRLFARGLYAHAPARHVWALGGKWSRLTGIAGAGRRARRHGGLEHRRRWPRALAQPAPARAARPRPSTCR